MLTTRQLLMLNLMKIGFVANDRHIFDLLFLTSHPTAVYAEWNTYRPIMTS